MRILQICPKPPVPSVDGGTLAMNAVTEGLLQAGISVKVLTIATTKHPFLAEKIPADYKMATGIEAVFIDTNVKYIPAFLNLFSASSYNVDRFYSIEFANKLKSVLEKETFDIIQLESLFVAPYLYLIRQFSKAKVVLRAHNVESQLWERRAMQENQSLKKCWFKNLSKKIYNYENEMIRNVDALLPITSEDATVFSDMMNGLKTKIHVLPYAMKLTEMNAEIIPKMNSVFHIGSMDWKPNQDGVEWLTKEVWPKVIAKIPTAALHLAGKDLKKDDAKYFGKNIFIHGRVEHAFQFINDYSVMTIPLFSGGGMKIKLVEGMALGKPIVSTSIGAEGTGAIHNKHLLIADDAEKFAEAICQLVSDISFSKKLGSQAHDFAKSNFEIAYASKKLTDFYTSLLK
jgi:glycosyltransferase involved in cell wall biosynthesis